MSLARHLEMRRMNGIISNLLDWQADIGPLQSELDMPCKFEQQSGPSRRWRGDKRPSSSNDEVAYARASRRSPFRQSAELMPPPYNQWLAIHDNTFLPLPQSVFGGRSLSANTSFDEAARAHARCHRNLFWPPQRRLQQIFTCLSIGDIHHVIIRKVLPKTRVRTSPSYIASNIQYDPPLFTPSLSVPMRIYSAIRIVFMAHHDGNS
ncbi:hypothetical protein M433DRAFT_225928 [Acidomyces richmondensis BFW]|nr:MAG: hypothetical protein FE78DRAFT_375450 [Acidomyces sp. 'richmondensis']KYG46007.1 hypothetical protein M433DRAFT_225928 [Acidomyces richmondensis BFW]